MFPTEAEHGLEVGRRFSVLFEVGTYLTAHSIEDRRGDEVAIPNQNPPAQHQGYEVGRQDV